MRDGIVFYRSFYEAIRDLPKENQAEIYDAIFSYWLDLEEKNLTWISKTIWTLVKPLLDANQKRYETWSKQWHHGKKWWRPKKNPTGDIEENPTGDIEENPTGDIEENPTGVWKKTPKDKRIKNKEEYKEDNKEKEIELAAPLILSPPTELEKTFEDFVTMRKKIKHPLTDEGKNLIIAELQKIGKDETERIQILKNSIMNWRRWVFPIKKEVFTSYNRNNDNKPKAWHVSTTWFADMIVWDDYE